MQDKQNASRRGSIAGKLGVAAERVLTRTWHAAARLLASLRYLSDNQVRQARLAFLQGSLQYDLGQYGASGESFARALQLEPGRVLTRVRLADLSLKDEDYDSALEILSGIGEDRSEWHPVTCELRGLALLHVGDCEQAIGYLTTWARLQPLEWRPHYYAGLSHLMLGNRQRAREHFQDAVYQMNPGIALLRLEEMIRVYRGIPSR
jgi:tetratricopeptide (TPR) repeat protein